MSSLAITFGAYTIPGAQDIKESLASRVSEVVIVKRDGAYIDDIPSRESKIISISGVLVAATADALRTSLDALNNKLASGLQQLTIHDDRYINAVKRSFDINKPRGWAGRSATYSIQFVCGDPYWYSTSLTSKTETLTNAGAGVAETFTTTPGGNAPTPARFLFTPTGTMTKLKVYNKTTSINSWFQYDGSVAATLQLEIDSSAKTCKMAGTNELSNLTGDFFLMEGGTVNTMDVSGLTQAGTMYYEYRARWF